jgi:CRISPR-associated protein Csx10
MTATLELVFEATDDVVLKDGASIGNVHRSLDFVPGSSLRGALAARWMRDQPVDDEFRRLFDTAVRVGDATPMSATSARTMPVPRSIQRCKASCPAPTVVDRVAAAVGGAEDLPACQSCGGRFKPLNGYVGPDGSKSTVELVARGQTATTSLGTALEGSLRYREAIKAGSRFVSSLRGEEADLQRFRDRCGIEEGMRLRVGESRSTRGSIRLSEIRPASLAIDGEDFFAVVLFSRAILVDHHLRPVVEPLSESDGCFAEEFDSAEQFDDGSVPEPVGTGRPMRWTAPPQPVAGWNGGQGVPKPIDMAVPAGSTYIYGLEHPEVVAADAVGLRRTEGFGELAVLSVQQHADLREAIERNIRGTA